MTTRKTKASLPRQSLEEEVEDVLESLKSLSSKRIRDEMGPRYGVHTDKAFGVSVSNIQKVAKLIGKNHQLALALWETGWYEARMLTSYVDEPELVTSSQMDRWCRDFDNWGICDTICFNLFDRTPFAFAKVEQWSKKKDEFVKRGGFALLACLAAHDKEAGDEKFLKCLPLIERAAFDERNFVKKGVSWALRMIGRRNPTLNSSALELAQQLVESNDPTARWLGRTAMKELTGVRKKMDSKRVKPKRSKSR